MRAGVDIYLLPAIVGGGLGDIDEVLRAGHRLARSGFELTLYRRAGRPLPRGVDGPWDWPPHRVVSSLQPSHRAAVTISPAWGVSAAPASDAPLGRPGPWAEEALDIERRYGAEQTLHASLEEFARTLTSAQENRERLREGGVSARQIRRNLRNGGGAKEQVEFADAFRRFRAFDRPNVAPLFAGFAPRGAFSREFPEAIQTGPLWPGLYRRGARRRPRCGTWVWYASPASAEALAPQVFEGLRQAEAPVRVVIRSPRPWRAVVPPELGTFASAPQAAIGWRRLFSGADLRIVTGSRTLLEALELGRPFLYFNGVLGAGAGRRRHRPEKIDALLECARGQGWPPALLRDLADFARGRRVREIVRRAAGQVGPWNEFPGPLRALPFPDGMDDLGKVLVRIARRLSRPDARASVIVRELRRESRSER